jgi:glycosyltransferase involved in cell wall biosynthesis
VKNITHKLNSKSPRFSIVIPCYNEEDYIASALESLCSQQTSCSYEVIVVDNNCTDRTAEIAAGYGARVVKETTPGICAARQAGTDVAKGEIIISTDADTNFSPSWLENYHQAYQDDPELVAVGGGCRYYDCPWWGKIYPKFQFGLDNLLYRLSGRVFYITANNISFKRAVFEGYDPLLSDYQGGDEIKLLHQLHEKGKVGFLPDNITFTSGRRLQNGLLYNLFVTFCFYYLAGYFINSLFKRRLIGNAPAFRNSQPQIQPNLVPLLVAVVVIGLPLMVANRQIKTFVSDNTKDVVAAVKHLI